MNTYKKFFITSILTIFSLVILFSGMLAILGFKIIGEEKICYMGSQVISEWYKQKTEYAEELSKQGRNRIVMISGSSGLFGVSTKILKAENIPLVNYSTHGGLCAYIFFQAKRILKPYDTVLLPLEYGFYSDNYEFDYLNDTVIPYTIGYDKEFYNQLNFADKFKTLNFLLSKAFYEKIRIGDSSIKSRDVYAYMLNKDGDIIENVAMKQDFKKNYSIVKVSAAFDHNNYEKWGLYEFIKWCQANNIKVVAMPPPIYHSNITMDFQEKKATEEIKNFYKELGVRYIGEPQDTFYSEEYMYDTNYHLNYKGRDKHTRYLINLLRENNIK